MRSETETETLPTMATVTSGELKIIEVNVRGIGNKEPHVKNFLRRRKKKADIFCIVEHKQTQSRKLLEQFAFGSYSVGASDCRRVGGPGGGVALLVHERLTGVQDAEGKFKHEFEVARAKSIEIAAVELKVKPKDCQNGLFVFGIYRRPANKSPLSEFINLICDLVQKVNGTYKSAAVFTGDFNVNNNKEGQITRSNKVLGQLLRFEHLGYRLTHSKRSHKQGSALNNFLVPTAMKYAQKTLIEGLGIPNPVKDSDHVPIQIIITLEIPRGHSLPQHSQHSLRHQAGFTFVDNVPNTSTTEHLPRETRQNADRGNSTFDENTPNTSTTRVERRLWSEENGVITILDDSDDEDVTSQSNHNQAQSPSLDQGHLNLFPIGNDLSQIKVKIEGDPRRSQHVPKHVGENSQTVCPNATFPRENAAQPIRQSVISNNTQTIPSPSQSSYFHSLAIPSGSRSVLQSIPVDSSSCNQQPIVINVSSGPTLIQRNDLVNSSNSSLPNVTSRPLQPTTEAQGKGNHSEMFLAEESVTIETAQRTPERTFQEVQTIRPEPSSRSTPYPQVQGAPGGRSLQHQLDELLEMERLKQMQLKVISELCEMKQKQSKILDEMKKSQ